MRKILFLFLMMVFCGYMSNAQTVTIGTVEATSGTSVSVPITLDGFTGDNAPAGITLFMTYDNTQLTSPAITNINSLLAGWVTNVANPPNIGAVWTNASAISIPDGTIIFYLSFTYTGTTPAAINFAPGCEFLNDFLDEIEVTYIAGGVVPPPQPLEAPVLNLPVDGATNVALNPNLSWLTVDGATSYTLQVSTTSDFSSFVVNQSGITDTDYNLNNLNYNTTYYWRANATDGSETSDWSLVWDFTTMQEPTSEPTATIGSLLNQAAGTISIPITLDGLNGDNAPAGITLFMTYNNAYLTNPVITDINPLLAGWVTNVANPPNIGAVWTNASAISIPNGTVIFRLQFNYNAGGDAAINFASGCEFLNDFLDVIEVNMVNGIVTAQEQPIVAPLLDFPVNGATNVALNPTLGWFSVNDATSYTLQVSTASDFTSFVVNESGITNLDYDLTDLNYNTTYYWRVNATDGTQTSDWSLVWNFTTEEEPTLPPTATIGSLFDQPAGTISIPVTLDGLNGDNAPAGITLFMTYDNAYLSNPVITDINPLLAGWVTNVANPPNIGAVWTNASAISIPDGTVIFNLQFNYNAGGDAAINFVAGCEFLNDNLDVIEVNMINGIVTPYGPVLTAPVLVTPLNNATDLPLENQFEWQAVNGAVTYNIQISTDANFSYLIFDTELPGLNTFVGGFDYETPYWWRVKALAGEVSGPWSEEWTFNTMEEPFVAPKATIGTLLEQPAGTVTIPVTLDGLNGDNAPAGITLFMTYDDAYLSNPIITDIDPLLSGWVTNVGNPPNIGAVWTNASAISIPNGTVIFNIQFTYNEGGDAAINFVAGCEFLNDNLDVIDVNLVNGLVTPLNPPVPPAPPVLVSPIDGAVDMPNPLEFTWMASEGAIEYYIEFSTNADFTEPVWGEWTTETSYIEDFWYFGETYYWRVKAANEFLIGDWSEDWDLTIRDFGVPMLLSPVDESIDIPIIPYTLLTWEGIPEAIAYNIEVSVDPTFAISTPYQVVETSLEVTGLDYLTTYYWRVSGYNNYQTGEWSQVWMFTTENYPILAPVLVSPLNGAELEENDVTLVWEAALNATTYNIEVSDDPTFATTIALQTSETTIDVLGLNYETTFYWRVNGFNNDFTGDWSVVWSFTIGEAPVPPPAPVLVSPLDGATNLPAEVLTLDWNFSIGADYYNIEVATNAAFENPIQYETAETSIDIYALDYLQTYYWRVNAVNQIGTGDWSTVWMFTTEPFIPAIPNLASPANGSINIPLQYDLQWYASWGADSYTIEVSWLEDFSETFGTTTTELTYAAEFMNYNYTYYWRVKANAGLFSSDWSEVWTLTTEAEYVPAPVLVAPVNGTTGILVAGTDLSWTVELPAIESYYEVATDINFTNIEFSDWTDLTTVFVGTFDYATEYFWRVKAKSELMNVSEWSETWSFITEDIPVPAAPVLVAPVNGTIGVPPAEVEFTWEYVPTAIEYYFELAHDANFTEIHYAGTVIGNETTLYNLEAEDTFYWRVNATNNLGGTSVWSEVWMFTTSEANPFIWTVNTGNNATVIVPYTATPTINTVPLTEGDWVAAYSPLGFCVGAVEWAIQPPPQTGNGITVWGDNDQTPITDGMIVGQTIQYQLYKAETETYYPVNNVTYSQGNGIYAVNGYYVISGMSYMDPNWIDPPVLVSPFDGTIDLAPALVEFNWQAAVNADMYNFELSTDINFSYTIALQTSETTIEVPGLLYGTTYYWRVNGYNEQFTSEWSEVWQFTTEQEIICDPPTIQARSLIFSNVTDNSIKVRWTRGNGEKALVVAYPDEIDAAPETFTAYFASSEYGEGSMIGTGYVVYAGTGDRVTVTGLFGGHKYTFKVYEFNYTECIAYNVEAGNNNPRSKSTLPPEPVIIPTTFKTDTGFEATWTYNGEVDWFEIYLYNDLGNLIDIIDVGDETSMFIDELTPATLYYYQVIANYGGSYTFSANAPAVATLDVEPLTGPTNMAAELGVINNTVNLTWDGAADRYLVLAYTSDPTGMPLDATEYTFDTDYSLAPVLGDGKIVYIGADNFTTVTGLEAFEHYFFKVYAFNGGVVYANTYPLNTHNYNIEEYGATDIWNVVLPAPVLLTPDSKWEEGFSTYWTYAIDPDYFELDANGDVFDLPGDLREFDVDGLLPNTLYNVKIRAIYSDITSEWSNIEQIKTLALEPAQPTNLVFTNVTDISATLTWTKAIGAEKTLVLAHQLGLTGEPVDNFGYPAGNSAYGDATQMIDGAFIVYNGTGNNFELTGLVASGIYYFELFAYNGDGILGDDILNSFNYNVVEPLLGELQTSVSAPTIPPMNVNFPVVGTTQMDVAWTPGNGTYSIVLAKINTAPFIPPTNGMNYIANSEFGLGDVIGDAYVVYVGTDANLTVTGLTQGTAYYFAVYTFNGIGGGTVYLDIPALGNETTKAPAPEPLGQDRVISFRNSQPTQVSLTWLLPTSGAGSYRLALVKEGAALAVEDFPVDGMTYTPNTVFGQGDQIGNAYAIYNGATIPTIANPLTVTGLTTGIPYHFRIFAYNSTEPGTENYNLNGAVFNPREKTAGSREAVAGDEYDGYEGNSLFNLSSIAPNPVKDAINFTMNVYDALPMTIEVYNADGLRVISVQEGTTMSIGEHSFSIPTGNIAAGFYILKVSTGSNEFAIQSFIVMP